MSVENPNTEPGFFGKDSFVPFIAQVEDVNDPKRSNRVKVRCLGWHPMSKKENDGEDEDALSTEDLPWAKVGMPNTMAQQGRTGGKHGLKPGSMVMGFFLDGYDAQDPFILSSFNFTAKTTKENNRKDVKTPEGTLPEDHPAFQKTNSKKEEATGTLLEDEQGGSDSKGDVSHDTTPDDSTDGECPIKRSSATKLKEGKKTPKGSPSGQDYKLPIADGLCGAAKSGRDQIANIMEENFPPEDTRFVYDDQVWNTFTGRYMNLNGIFNKMSQEVSALMRQAIQTEKGNIEKLENKQVHSEGVFAAATRDEITAKTADFALSTGGDLFHNAFNKMIGEMGAQVLQSLQNINNQQQAAKGQNNTSGTGSTSNTSITNTSSLSLTDSIIADVETKFRSVLEEEKTKRDSNYAKEADRINEMKEKILSTTGDDYECKEDMQTQFQPEEEEDSGDGAGSSYLDMMTQFEYLANPKLFNKTGFLQVLDGLTGQGCNVEDMFSTAQGMLGGIGGVGGGQQGGGSSSGRSSKNDSDLYKNTGFCGRPLNVDARRTYEEADEDAFTTTISDSEKQDILETLEFWQPVDLHEPGRTYELEGEQLIDGTQSDNNRVLVDNQDNPAENGIYVTGVGPWTRAGDASENSHFTYYKIVTVPKPNVEDRYYVYTGINIPRLDSQIISFTRLFYT